MLPIDIRSWGDDTTVLEEEVAEAVPVNAQDILRAPVTKGRFFWHTYRM